MIVDLHGLTEQEAIMEIMGALTTLEFEDSLDEVEIITGRGLTLTRVLEQILEEDNYEWTHNGSNYGSYIVFKK